MQVLDTVGLNILLKYLEDLHKPVSLDLLDQIFEDVLNGSYTTYVSGGGLGEWEENLKSEENSDENSDENYDAYLTDSEGVGEWE